MHRQAQKGQAEMGRRLKGAAFQFGAALELNGVRASDFFSWLEKRHGNGSLYWPTFEKPDTEEDSDVHKLWLQQKGNLISGLIVTTNEASIQYFENVKNGKTIIVPSVVEGAHPIQINLFCIRKDTCKGIYSSHRGSLPLTNFLYNLWHCYSCFVRKYSALHEDGADYSLYGRKQTEPLFSGQEFKALVDQMKTVTEISFSTVSTNLPEEAPVPPSIKSVHEVYRLVPVKGTGVSEFALWVRGLAGQGRRKPSGRVVGEYADGSPASIDFHRTLGDRLPNLTSDDIGSIDTSDIFSNAVVEKMCTSLNKEPIFKIQQEPCKQDQARAKRP